MGITQEDDDVHSREWCLEREQRGQDLRALSETEHTLDVGKETEHRAEGDPGASELMKSCWVSFGIEAFFHPGNVLEPGLSASSGKRRLWDVCTGESLCSSLLLVCF